MSRRYLGCDRCDAGAWIGPAAGDHHDAWCEACQRPTSVPAGAEAPACPACGAPLTLGEPRFEELFGELQSLAAVLEAWGGDPARLVPLVPDRPRFLTDLDPPSPSNEDGAETRAALAALLSGAFVEARRMLEASLAGATGAGSPRTWRALGIACQRLADGAAAEEAYGRALEQDAADAVARLDRGALRARRGDFAGARADLDHAGERREARWNRAALTLLEAVSRAPGVPEAARIEAARREAGAPSPHWSDPTVGRLLFALLAERAEARGVRGDPAGADARALRSAERELEFETFDDRAMVLRAYARLGLAADAERVARPLVAALLGRLANEPFARGRAGAWLAEALTRVRAAANARRPAEGLAAVVPLLDRRDLRHYRIPCARCGQGAVGVERVEEESIVAAPAASA